MWVVEERGISDRRSIFECNLTVFLHRRGIGLVGEVILDGPESSSRELLAHELH